MAPLATQSPSLIVRTWLPLCRWDEWVPVSRLLKHNEQNIATQRALQATAYPHGQNGSGRGPLFGSNNGPGGSSVGGSNGLKGGAGSRGGARKDGTHGGRGQKRTRDEVRFSPAQNGPRNDANERRTMLARNRK